MRQDIYVHCDEELHEMSIKFQLVFVSFIASHI